MTNDKKQTQQDLLNAENELMVLREKIGKLRRELANAQVQDYELKDSKGEAVALSSLFGDKDDLIVIHNMGKSCSYCTLWADGFEGFRPHLEDRAAFVLVSHDSPEDTKEFVASRNWSYKTLSGQGSSFTKDMGYESDDGSPQPGMSTFYRDKGGKIFRASTAAFGPGDDFCSIWHMFDLLADGPKGWSPKYKY